MNLRSRLARLEQVVRKVANCSRCFGMPGPLVRATFDNGDAPVEVGRCTCGGKETVTPRLYHLPSRELFDAV